MNDEIRSHFEVRPERIYLDAATFGLPPGAAVDAYRRAIDQWEQGTARFETDWEPEGERCRELFAQLIGARPEHICLLPTVSTGVGTLAASLPAGSMVLVPEDEFASLALPFVAMSRLHGHQVQVTPWEALADAIAPGIDVVACSLTRAQDGRTIDLAEIAARATAAGAVLVIDATHALPFVSVGEHLEGIDLLVCHGYKHLLSPRGTAFAYISPRIWSQLAIVNANWRSSGHSYGTNLPEPRSAAAFDISLAWHAARAGAPAPVEGRRLHRSVAGTGDAPRDGARDSRAESVAGLPPCPGSGRHRDPPGRARTPLRWPGR